MPRSRQQEGDEPHDILAADAFAGPAAADADTPEARAHSGREFPSDPAGATPHDILVAEEFAIPAVADADTPAARAHRGLPSDPVGEQPHDVLAAEDFAVPAGADFVARTPSGPAAHHVALAAFAGAVAVAAVLRRLTRR